MAIGREASSLLALHGKRGVARLWHPREAPLDCVGVSHAVTES